MPGIHKSQITSTKSQTKLIKKPFGILNLVIVIWSLIVAG